MCVSHLPLVPHLLFGLLFIPDHVYVPVFPVGLSHFDRTATDIFTVHFSHGFSEVAGLFEADEAEAFGLVGLLVSDHFGLLKGGVPTECPS